MHAVDVSWSAAGFPPPPSTYNQNPRPSLGQLHGHPAVLQDAVVSNWHRDIFSQAFTRTHMLVLFLLLATGLFTQGGTFTSDTARVSELVPTEYQRREQRESSCR